MVLAPNEIKNAGSQQLLTGINPAPAPAGDPVKGWKSKAGRRGEDQKDKTFTTKSI
jgi:hypothetical protein